MATASWGRQLVRLAAGAMCSRQASWTLGWQACQQEALRQFAGWAPRKWRPTATTRTSGRRCEHRGWNGGSIAAGPSLSPHSHTSFHTTFAATSTDRLITSNLNKQAVLRTCPNCAMERRTQPCFESLPLMLPNLARVRALSRCALLPPITSAVHRLCNPIMHAFTFQRQVSIPI